MQFIILKLHYDVWMDIAHTLYYEYAFKQERNIGVVTCTTRLNIYISNSTTTWLK